MCSYLVTVQTAGRQLLLPCELTTAVQCMLQGYGPTSGTPMDLSCSMRDMYVGTSLRIRAEGS